MAKKTLVASTLAHQLVDDGAKFVRFLAEQGLPIASAMWIKLSENEPWRLYISTPNVEKHGPIAVYKFIDKALRRLKIESFEFNDVVAANTTNHFVNAFTSVIRMEDGIVVFVDCTLSGVPVQEAVVFISNKSAAATREMPQIRPVKKGKEAIAVP